MAPRKGLKRPTTRQIEARMKRGAAYLAFTGEPFDVAAGKFRKTQKQLKSFLFGGAKNIRRNFNRNKAYRDLYEQLGKAGQPILGVKRIPKIRLTFEPGPTIHIGRKATTKERKFAVTTEGTPRRIKSAYSYEQRRRASVLAHAVLLGEETPEATMSIAWQIYASEKEIPVSINAIRDMYAAGEISRARTITILTHWRNIYPNITDTYYEQMLEKFGLE